MMKMTNNINWDNHPEALKKAGELSYALEARVGQKLKLTETNERFRSFEFDCLDALMSFLKQKAVIEELVTRGGPGYQHEFEVTMVVNTVCEITTSLTSATDGIFYHREAGLKYDRDTETASLDHLEDAFIRLNRLRAFLTFKGLAGESDFREYYTLLCKQRQEDALRTVARVTGADEDLLLTRTDLVETCEVNDDRQT